MTTKFLRADAHRFSKFGKGRGKKATYRRAKGRDNKMRERIRGQPAMVSIGFRSDKDQRDKLKDKTPLTILNVSDLENITKEHIAKLGKVGKKKKIEIMKKAKELKIEFANENVESFLKKIEKENKLKEKKK